MRRHSHHSLAVVAVSLLLHAAPVLAADAPCGATATAAIASAEKALASKDDKAQAQALTCLLEVVKRINADPGTSDKLLHVPSGNKWKKPK